MKRYDSYKDSGVEWIGEIPSHWSLKKIKEVFQNRNEKNDEMCEDFLSITRDRGVIPYSEKGNIGNKTSDDIGKYKRVYPNDIVINPMNIIIGSVGISKYSGVLSNVYIVLESFGIHPVYGSFIFHMTSFQKHLKKICYGIMELRESLNKIEFFVEQIPVPPLSEQQQIVSFLDSKTSQIDELIQKKERKIELLKEYRTSLINQVVTKGLNPNVEMKDSGVGWIGEIPSHWFCVGTNKVYNDLGTGTTPTSDKSEYYSENGYHWITTTDLNEGIMDDTLTKITVKSIEDYPNLTLYPSGSIYISMYGGRIGKLGISTFDSYCNQSVCVLPLNEKVIVKFYYYWFLGFQEFVKGMGRGGGQPNINKEMIKSFPTVKNPISEQQQIVKYLDEQTKEIDSTIQIEERKIELLKEYRQSLISSVVTGKIDVRTN